MDNNSPFPKKVSNYFTFSQTTSGVKHAPYLLFGEFGKIIVTVLFEVLYGSINLVRALNSSE